MPDYTIIVKVDSSQAQKGIADVDKGLTKTGTTAQKMSGLIAKAFAFVGVTAGIQQVIKLSDAFVQLQNSLRLVTDSQAELANVTSTVVNIANSTFQSVSAVAALYTKTALATDDLGVSTSEVATFVELLGKALVISGASAQGAEQVLFQLSQALGRNRLSGDELVTVLEQMPIVLDVLSTSLNKSKAEILEMASAGELTGPVLINAFIQARDIIEGPFAGSLITAGQAFQVLQNNITIYVGELLQATGIHQAFVASILFVANNLDLLARILLTVSIALGTTFAVQAVGAAVAGLQRLTLAALANPFIALLAAVTLAISGLIAFSDQIAVTADGTTTLLDVMKSGFLSAVGVISDALSTIIQFLSEFFSAATANLDFTAILESVLTVFNFFAIRMQEDLNFIVTVIQNMVTQGVALFQEFIAAFPQITQVFNTVITEIQSFVAEALGFLSELTFEDVILTLAQGGDLILAVFEGLQAGIEAISEDPLGFLVDAFRVGLNEVLQLVEQGINFIIDGFTELPQALFEAGVNAISSLAQGIINTLGSVLNVVKQIPGLIQQALAGEIGIIDISNQFADALIKSIQSGFQSVYGTLRVEIGRLALETQGTAGQVGTAVGTAITDSIEAAPITNHISDVLNQSMTMAANQVGNDLPQIFKPVLKPQDIPITADTTQAVEQVDKLNTEIGKTGDIAAVEADKVKQAYDQAFTSMSEGAADFLTITTQEFEQVGKNIDSVLQAIGINVQEIFANMPAAVKEFAASIATDLNNALGIAGIVLDELGVTIEDVFGKRASTAIRIFSRLSSDQIDLIIRSGEGVIAFFQGPFAAAIQGVTGLFGVTADAAGGFFDQIIAAGQSVLDFFGVDLASAAGGAFDSIVAAGQPVLEYFGIDLTGAIEAVKGVFGGMGDEAVEETGKVEEAGQGLADFFKSLPDIINSVVDTIIGIFERVATGISNILTSIATGISNFLTIVAQGVANVITILAQGISTGIITIANGVAEAILSIGFALAAVLAALAPFVIVMLVLSVLLAAVALVLFAIAAVIEALAELIEALVPIVLALIDAFSEFGFSFDSIFAGMTDIVEAFGELFVAIFTAIIEGVIALFQGMLEILIGIFTLLGEFITAFVNLLTEIFTTLINGIIALFQVMSEFIIAIFTVLQEFITAFVDLIVALFTAMGELITAIFQVLSEFIIGIFNAIGEAANALTQLIIGFFQAMSEILIGIFNALLDLFIGIMSAMGDAVAAFIDLAIGLMESAADIAIGVWDAFGGAFEGIMDAVSGAVDAFGSVVTGVFSAAADIIGALVGIVSDIIGLFIDLAAAAIDAAEAIASIEPPDIGGGGIIDDIFGGIFAKGGTVMGKSVYMAPKGSVLAGSNGNMAGGGMFTLPSVLLGNLQQSGGGRFDFGLVGEAGPERILPTGKSGMKGSSGSVTNNFQISVRGASQKDIAQLVNLVKELEGSFDIIGQEVAVDTMESVWNWG